MAGGGQTADARRVFDGGPMSAAPTNDLTVSETLGGWLAGLSLSDLPAATRGIVLRDMIDMAGLCVAARRSEYMSQILRACDADGPCTAIGQARGLDAGGAALANGVATHGEDFDDTLEGAPIRVAAMTIPAALAAAERFGLSGERATLGIAAGLETVCRLNHVAPGAIHRAGFHPVGVIGALGAAAAAGVAIGLDARRMATAFGIAGSFSSGIIEYLTDGAWTKRLHPGWAAQSGLKAALIAREGFFAPRTVFDGPHNFFKAFAPSATPDYATALGDLGETWCLDRIVFKPFACGTMIHPYMDCAIELSERLEAEGAAPAVAAERIERVICEAGEGLVHRLWEPLAAKQTPPSGYAAKFSMPYCMAAAFFDRAGGFAQFTDERAADPATRALAAKISYVIDPENEYPRNYTGHMRVRMTDGREIELRRPHMRGGVHAPLRDEEIVAKFHGNIAHGGWSAAAGDRLLDFCRELPNAPNLSELATFRGER